MKSTTIRISLEAYRLIRDTVAATGERPGDVVLRALKGAYQPVAQTPAQEGRLGPHSIRLTPRDVEIVNGYAAMTREPFNVALQNAVHNALVAMSERVAAIGAEKKKKKRRRNFKSQAEARAEFEKTMRGAYENGVWVPRVSEEVERQFLREQAERAARDRPKMGTLTADERLWAEADAASAVGQKEPAR